MGNSKGSSFFRCTYDIKKINVYTQIINNSYKTNVNEEIEAKVKIMKNGKKENLIFKEKFERIGMHTVDFTIEGKLKDMSFMFNNCSTLISINFISIQTDQVTNMNGMFQECK